MLQLFTESKDWQQSSSQDLFLVLHLQICGSRAPQSSTVSVFFYSTWKKCMCKVLCMEPNYGQIWRNT
jgi:hypothetical protein